LNSIETRSSAIKYPKETTTISLLYLKPNRGEVIAIAPRCPNGLYYLREYLGKDKKERGFIRRIKDVPKYRMSWRRATIKQRN
jgi:hypothetical protein